MFCPDCKSMVFPKDGCYYCKNCDKLIEEEVESEGFTTKSKAKETAVVSDGEAVLPKAREICAKCGNTEAYYYMRQNRSADEPETIFYRCTRCNYQWKV